MPPPLCTYFFCYTAIYVLLALPHWNVFGFDVWPGQTHCWMPLYNRGIRKCTASLRYEIVNESSGSLGGNTLSCNSRTEIEEEKMKPFQSYINKCIAVNVDWTYSASMRFFAGMSSHVHYEHVLSLKRLLLSGTILPLTNEGLLVGPDMVVVQMLWETKKESALSFGRLWIRRSVLSVCLSTVPNACACVWQKPSKVKEGGCKNGVRICILFLPSFLNNLIGS